LPAIHEAKAAAAAAAAVASTRLSVRPAGRPWPGAKTNLARV